MTEQVTAPDFTEAVRVNNLSEGDDLKPQIVPVEIDTDVQNRNSRITLDEIEYQLDHGLLGEPYEYYSDW